MDIGTRIVIVRRSIMVTNDEIRRMLDAKRRGVDIKKEKTQSMSYKTCPKCGAKNPENAIFCVQCGKKLDQKLTVKCPSCGVENAKNAKFCVECGETLNKISETVMKAKLMMQKKIQKL